MKVIRLAAPLCLTLSLAAAARAETEDPWALVDQIRIALEEVSPLSATFTQLYQPAGFSSAETETGTLALDLPACLRWDYSEPFPRSYLLCDQTAWTWNEGESSGRRYAVAASDQAGLDLLRLRVGELRRRYRARLGSSEPQRTQIALTPISATQIRDATLTINLLDRTVVSLSYHDAEGNLTRFDFSSYRPLAVAGRFEAPVLEWLDQ